MDGRADQLRDAERRRLRALVERDLPVAEQLHADDYQLITPGGERLSGVEYLGLVRDGLLTYRRFAADGEIWVRLWEDAAAVRYRADIAVETPDGSSEGRFWHTDLYELRDGRWQVVWSQATRIRGEE